MPDNQLEIALPIAPPILAAKPLPAMAVALAAIAWAEAVPGGDAAAFAAEESVARNTARARTSEGSGIGATPAATSADPYEQVKDKELGERIRAAIAELTPAHKAVILLREVEGLSYEEISEVLQCSRGTVMSRLHYARKRLQSLLRHDL